MCAAVMRTLIHFYQGDRGIAVVAFAVANVVIYHHTRRLLPLIVAHAGYDMLLKLDPTALCISLGAVAVLSSGWMLWIWAVLTRPTRDYSGLEEIPMARSGASPEPESAAGHALTIVIDPSRPDEARGSIFGSRPTDPTQPVS